MEKKTTVSVDAELRAYTKKLHLIGTSTMMAVLVLTFCPALYIFIAYDLSLIHI